MYTNLRTAMTRKGITIEVIAQLLGLHRNTVANKLEGESEFTFSQAETIRDILFPEYSDKFLFAREERTA